MDQNDCINCLEDKIEALREEASYGCPASQAEIARLEAEIAKVLSYDWLSEQLDEYHANCM